MRKNEESNLQIACVKWFRYQYPKLHLFAIPNGGNRDYITGAILKAEGVLAGVADLMLVPPALGMPILFIEMKTQKGRQSPSQKEFQAAMQAIGHIYTICRSIEDFITTIQQYLTHHSPQNLSPL